MRHNQMFFVQFLKRTKMLTLSGERDDLCLFTIYPLYNVLWCALIEIKQLKFLIVSFVTVSSVINCWELLLIITWEVFVYRTPAWPNISCVWYCLAMQQTLWEACPHLTQGVFGQSSFLNTHSTAELPWELKLLAACRVVLHWDIA